MSGHLNLPSTQAVLDQAVQIHNSSAAAHTKFSGVDGPYFVLRFGPFACIVTVINDTMGMLLMD